MYYPNLLQSQQGRRTMKRNFNFSPQRECYKENIVSEELNKNIKLNREISENDYISSPEYSLKSLEKTCNPIKYNVKKDECSKDLLDYSQIDILSKDYNILLTELKETYCDENTKNTNDVYSVINNFTSTSSSNKSETTQNSTTSKNYNKERVEIIINPDDLFKKSHVNINKTSKLIKGLVLDDDISSYHMEEKTCKKHDIKLLCAEEKILKTYLSKMNCNLVFYVNCEERQFEFIDIIENSSIHDLFTIYQEIKTNIVQAMTSNYICFAFQKMMKISNKKLRLSIVRDIKDDIMQIATNHRGNHSLQTLVSKMIEHDEISHFMNLIVSDNMVLHEMCKVSPLLN